MAPNRPNAGSPAQRLYYLTVPLPMWPSPRAVFDPTGAISIGVKHLGQMAPLLGQIQMRNALLEALNEQVIPKADQSDVLSIINRSGSPHFLMSRLSESKDTLERVWRETIDFAGRMQAAQKDLGLPDSAL